MTGAGYHYNVQAREKEVKLIIGSIVGDGSAVHTGFGFNVTKTATGRFLITLDQKYPSIISVQASVQQDGYSATDIHVNVGLTSASAGTVELQLRDSSSALKDQSGVNIDFVIFVKNTTLAR